MKQHEREYFISRIRSGIFIINQKGLKLKVCSPKLESELELSEEYRKAYDEAFDEGVMSESEMLSWMGDKGLWTEEDESKVKGLEDDLERLKIEIYESRYSPGLVDQIRMGLRIGERQLKEQVAKKGHFTANTCEGIASIERARALTRQNTYLNGELYDFELLDTDEVLTTYNSLLCSEKMMRELVNNDPWKLIWYMREIEGSSLFVDKGRQLTPDQKNIVVWSRMYDSVHESQDCPSESVIADFDMLDGWFIVQKRKREKDKSDREFESDHGHSKDADEVFMVAKDSANLRRIKSMNDVNAKMKIKEREARLRQRGNVDHGDFKDVKLEARSKANEMYKDKFKK
jgi:hypothetical protein